MRAKLTLQPPAKTGRAFYIIRGTYQGVRVYKSCGTADKKLASQILAKVKDEIERGVLSTKRGLSFADAAVAYLDGGGDARFLAPLNQHFGDTSVADISQALLDSAAMALYPRASPATRNRQVYTPFLAILNHNGIAQKYRRPKGAQGAQRQVYLEPEQAWKLIDAATGIDRELAALFLVGLYTGLRLGELLQMRCESANIACGRVLVGKTKNGDPRLVHLPPAAIAALANHPRGLDRGEEYVFRWNRSRKGLYALATSAYQAAGVNDGGAPFHILRHTFASFMRRYANADTRDLLDTGAWRSAASVHRYVHTDVKAAARLADLLPVKVGK